MKISPRDAEAFLKSPDPAARAVLVYGPDAGLVRERVEALIKGAAGDLADPFRVADFAAKELIGDAAVVFPPASPQDIANAVERMLRDPDHYRQLARATEAHKPNLFDDQRSFRTALSEAFRVALGEREEQLKREEVGHHAR